MVPPRHSVLCAIRYLLAVCCCSAFLLPHCFGSSRISSHLTVRLPPSSLLAGLPTRRWPSLANVSCYCVDFHQTRRPRPLPRQLRLRRARIHRLHLRLRPPRRSPTASRSPRACCARHRRPLRGLARRSPSGRTSAAVSLATASAPRGARAGPVPRALRGSRRPSPRHVPSGRVGASLRKVCRE